MNTQQLAYSYKQISSSGNVCANDGVLGGVLCSSSTSGTITIYDDAATGTTTKIVDTMPLVAGQWVPMPFGFSKGLNVVIGGTASVTVGYVMG